MCWTGIAAPIVAENDIVCHKIVRKSNWQHNIYLPYFRYMFTNMTYEIGKTYEAKITTSGNLYREVDIHEGLHCYDSSNKIMVSKYGLTPINSTVGCTYFYENRPVTLKCVIPKGTKYYENKYGEIVTEKLKVIKEL